MSVKAMINNKGSDSEDPFQAIRPFNDDEFRQVIDRTAQDKKLSLVLARAASQLPLVQKILTPMLAWRIKKTFANMQHIADFQLWLSSYVEKMLAQTTSGLTVSGLDQLDNQQHYLWLSNHRDIALDPTLVNYALHLKGDDTGRIAIGDNLLDDPLVADLMRLNKSFVVQRSVKSKREKLNALQLLSRYIAFSINDGHSVWLAQQEGRAKDGVDKTDTAVLKMLSLFGRPDKLSFSDSLQQLNPIPVSISYEHDPCDLLKAQELVLAQHNDDYEKPSGEDIKSIFQGIMGDKGRVHVAFGQPIEADKFCDANTLAAEIDRQIIANYKLFPINYAAHYLLVEKSRLKMPADKYPVDIHDSVDWLRQRVLGQTEEVVVQLLEMYAQPYIRQAAM